MTTDSFNAAKSIDTPLGKLKAYDLNALREAGVGHVEKLPYSIRVLLEAVLRNVDGFAITDDHVRKIANYDAKNVGEVEIPFKPGRVVLQDFTGVPAVVDLAALRSAMHRLGGNPKDINPQVPCDLVIDHSVQVDTFGTKDALQINASKEFERNRERYEFLKWGQSSFENFRAVPPATGIVHQVNLEYLASCVLQRTVNGTVEVYPDSLVGTDSHTTMINGLGVVGWGVGGIEAEAVMLGQPIYMLLPEVVGFELTGRLGDGATATDLVLTVTQMLRKKGVVGKFVEFYGAGLDTMSLPDRATIANMAPEYGATMGFFPVDEQTLHYLRRTGRDEKLVQTVEQYYKAVGLWRDDAQPIEYVDTLKLDLGEVQASLAGPKRPQDKILLSDMKGQWSIDREKTYGHDQVRTQTFELDGATHTLTDGSVVIAAITSCTNTSNPPVLVAAGLVARKARQLGLTRKPWVKTSLAPGSRVVTDYLDKAGLTEDLEAIGFHTVGYGCTTCIGNSGPLIPEVSAAIRAGDLAAAAVLSGNRNFEGRVNPDVQPSYLASPPLVVAYALAGTVDVNLAAEPIGKSSDGRDVFLKDIWPSADEINALIAEAVTTEQFTSRYAEVDKGPAEWQAVSVTESDVYAWDDKSTYVQEPPFFVGMSKDVSPITAIKGAKVLVKVSDSVTTDHISPAGTIKADSPAGKYLIGQGVAQAMFNSYGSRRGNDRVMTRGTFANIRLRNELAPGTEGGFTTYFGAAAHGDVKPNEVTTIYEAAMAYKEENTPLVVLAGKDYGMGSSRDWAAKGTFLLGVKAVIAESFERIHRSNLVFMGVLPLQFKGGESKASLGLDGTEVFDIAIDDSVEPLQTLKATATKRDGATVSFEVTCRIDTPVEVDYYRNGGILHTVLRKIANA